ncbi:hypothetical protein ACWDD9_20105 [Kitasatospora sp. NPDC001119]
MLLVEVLRWRRTTVVRRNSGSGSHARSSLRLRWSRTEVVRRNVLGEGVLERLDGAAMEPHRSGAEKRYLTCWFIR